MKLLIQQDGGYDKLALLRILLLYVFEGIDDIHDLTGGIFSKALVELKINPELLQELKESKKKFTNFKKEYYEDLKLYRNTVGAHRDFDFQKYTHLIIKSEETSIIKIVTIFDSMLNDFAKIIDKIIKESTELKKKLLENES